MDERATPQDSPWRWPREPEWLQSSSGRAVTRTESQSAGLPEGVAENSELRRAVIECPDDDAPRQAYADWMLHQKHEFAQLLGQFISAQLRIAQTFRVDRRASVTAHLRWRGDTAHVSLSAFRAGDVLRPWLLGSVGALQSMGFVGWPQVYRGFIERVGVRASRFLEIADELFQLAPIRYLVMVDVPEFVDQLAASPHLARIRSLSLPRYVPEDELTDDTLKQLIASPHLRRLAHLRLVHQHRVTFRGYERAVTAPTLPQLSSFEVYARRYRWDHVAAVGDGTMSRFNRMIAYDTPLRSVQSKDWLVGLEHAVGYVPCAHPERHYGNGWDRIDIEAIVENPIALDAQIALRRGEPLRRRRRAWRR